MVASTTLDTDLQATDLQATDLQATDLQATDPQATDLEPAVRRTGRRPVPAAAGLAAERYAPEPTRCVVESVLRWRRVALWRIRLRAVAVDLTVQPSRGSAGQLATLDAQIAVRPRFVSLPATAGLFLPDVPRDQRVAVTASSIPAAFERGSTIHSPARATVGERSWDFDLAVETVLHDDDRLILAITGELPRDVAIPFGGCAMHIDAAIEFHRWA